MFFFGVKNFYIEQHGSYLLLVFTHNVTTIHSNYRGTYFEAFGYLSKTIMIWLVSIASRSCQLKKLFVPDV
eukprot:snap_masked-scaffold_18-processed-gene-3.29-mRNA-1 protein AED:1.00 eAED:1.00 QI:0/0/0/0/1/1/2/0/70